MKKTCHLIFLGIWLDFNVLFGVKNLRQDTVIIGKAREGKRTRDTHTWKGAKTKHLDHWENTTDLVSEVDVYPTQGPSQDFSLSGTEMVGSSAQGLGCSAKLMVLSQFSCCWVNLQIVLWDSGMFQHFWLYFTLSYMHCAESRQPSEKDGGRRFSNISDVKISLVFYMHHSK